MATVNVLLFDGSGTHSDTFLRLMPSDWVISHHSHVPSFKEAMYGQLGLPKSDEPLFDVAVVAVADDDTFDRGQVETLLGSAATSKPTIWLQSRYEAVETPPGIIGFPLDLLTDENEHRTRFITVVEAFAKSTEPVKVQSPEVVAQHIALVASQLSDLRINSIQHEIDTLKDISSKLKNLAQDPDSTTVLTRETQLAVKQSLEVVWRVVDEVVKHPLGTLALSGITAHLLAAGGPASASVLLASAAILQGKDLVRKARERLSDLVN